MMFKAWDTVLSWPSPAAITKHDQPLLAITKHIKRDFVLFAGMVQVFDWSTSHEAQGASPAFPSTTGDDGTVSQLRSGKGGSLAKKMKMAGSVQKIGLSRFMDQRWPIHDTGWG